MTVTTVLLLDTDGVTEEIVSVSVAAVVKVKDKVEMVKSFINWSNLT
jgi:hypothetical protein